MRESFYKVVQELSNTKDKKIYLVQHVISQLFFIKKVLPPAADISIYEQLKAHPHPNMANIIELENREEALVLIEEYVNGTTLAYEASTGCLTTEQILGILQELFEVIQHLHQLQPAIIHRDIKPENIMIEKGHVKLIDFEIARKVQLDKKRDTQIIGSVGYAAPEQYGFRQSDQRSDIYALGVLMKELMEDRKDAACYQYIIERCMELEPNRRYQSVRELQREVSKLDRYSPALRMQVAPTWRIPGFQQEKLSQKLLIFLFYALVILVSFSIEIKTPITGSSLFFAKLSYIVIFTLLLWVPKNVGNILEILPLYRSKHKFIRVMNGVLIWLLCSFVCVFVFALMAITLDQL